MLTTLTTFALLAGGGVPASRSPTASVTAAPIMANGVTLSVPLQLGQNCPRNVVACSSGEPALSLAQIRSLAQVFGADISLTKPSKTSPGTLHLAFPSSKVGIYGIGLPPMFNLKGESYYSASSILGFLAQSSPNAYYTASPRLQLHADRVTVDMGAVPAEKIKLFFSGLAFSLAEELLPETFRPAMPCQKCDTSGVTSITWSASPPARLQTSLAPGEVVMLLIYNPSFFKERNAPYITATGIVGTGGWVSLPVEKLPARMVTDLTQLRPDPLHEGNGVLLRVTNTPLGDLSKGLVPSR